jgi:hypothetical protein
VSKKGQHLLNACKLHFVRNVKFYCFGKVSFETEVVERGIL